MAISSKLKIYSRDGLFVESIMRSLRPDNVNVPPGLTIRDYAAREGDLYVYVYEIELNEKLRGFSALKGTLDEVLTIVHALYETTLK